MRCLCRLMLALSIFALVVPGKSLGAELKVIASGAVKEAIVDLVADFEKSSGHKVTLIWAGTEATTKRVAEGEAVDVALIAAANIDKLIAAGKLTVRSDIAKSGVGVAVREGMPKPDISSGDAVKKAVLEAKSVAYSSGPSGSYLVELFKRMGIADQIKDKVKQTPSGVLVGDVVARGEADLGFQQISELIHLKGIHYLGPLPPDIQQTTVFSAGVHSSSASPEAAKALINFLVRPESAVSIRKAGMEPG